MRTRPKQKEKRKKKKKKTKGKKEKQGGQENAPQVVLCMTLWTHSRSILKKLPKHETPSQFEPVAVRAFSCH
jgi:hypothetical protein